MVLIALGANTSGHMGSPLQTIKWAMEEMTHHQLSVISISSFYRTKAIGQQGQPDYVNGVVRVQSAMSAMNVLKNLKQIEKAAGRDLRQNLIDGHWGSRPLDLDIIDYKRSVSENYHACSGDKRVKKGMQSMRCDLILPHPQAHFRPFVIRPIVDIDPFWHHPVSGFSASSIWAKLQHHHEGQILQKVE